MKELKPLPVRVDKETYRKLKELADKDRRSLNNYVNIILEKHIENV